jgi:hypothetical protein
MPAPTYDFTTSQTLEINRSNDLSGLRSDVGFLQSSMGPNPLWAYHGQALHEKGIIFPVTGGLISQEGALSFSPIIEMLALFMKQSVEILSFPETTAYNTDDYPTQNSFICPAGLSSGTRQFTLKLETMNFPFYTFYVEAPGDYDNFTLSFNNGTDPQSDYVIDDAGVFLAIKVQTDVSDPDGGPNNVMKCSVIIVKVSDSYTALL